MSQSKKPVLTRRTLLGGATAAGVGAAFGSVLPAHADAGGASRPNAIEQGRIDAVAARLDRGLIALRDDIHRHPEAAGEERRTAALVAARLRAAGLSVRRGVGGTGVVGVLDGALPGRTVAYRADMDAVPPGDQIEGGAEVAHCCGHDLHTAIGVGVAQVLARLRDRLGGRLVFFFQPGEEALMGARAMIDAGVLEWTRPEEIHALHCGPFPVGRLAVTPGVGLPGLDRPTIAVPGPDAAERARRLAAEINGLGTVAFPETHADYERVVRELETPDGPLARFILTNARTGEPDAAGRGTVEVAYRCWPEERYVEVREQIGRVAAAYEGARVDFSADPFPAMVCPEKDALALNRHLRGTFGPGATTELHAAFPFNGEDFALFLDRMPGTFTFLGVRRPGADITTCYPHFGGFDPDLRAIGVGVRAMSGWLAERLRG
ncbi:MULTISPECIES: M20 family metallopeptidase [Actinomadura]|uniref:M20/M25/M40 family metallo-hydrolase n=1 Tax=Actinomadura litoris TaxID=2678616 RepID=A0A7K1KSS6_9ACTN|nr:MULTISPECIES: M20/M25/M40 family metallo-hydrolase [Actinomadura]MBT2207934.1 M20/M25/M40 family metallo-hydrolase [Actinomadura sp. NEAU-AAG7]MUN35222.1 M20/M25/M40 family metallo-hydrolase [Actinomadura litoris]